MSNYIKPQTPIYNEGNDSYIYPLTTSDQVIMEDGSKLNSKILELKPKAGFIYPLASEIVPDGFVLCDGAEYNREEYVELFAAIGTMYGSGDGSTTFNVPNLQTRVPIGSGEGYELGDVGGEESHTLTVDEMPSHNHLAGRSVYLQGGSSAAGYDTGATFDNAGKTMYTGGSQPHNNMQPYTVVNYIIATGKNTGIGVADIITGVQALPLSVEYGGTGATDILDIHKNLKIKATARNLLDNSDFTNPINQRGMQSGSMNMYSYPIDRWTAADTTPIITFKSNGIELKGSSGLIAQRLQMRDNDIGKTFTAAIKLTDGTLCIGSGIYKAVGGWTNFIVTPNSGSVRVIAHDLDNKIVNFGIASLEDVTVQWAALYEGEYTVETLPKYQPKGYGVELAECLRYYQRTGSIIVPLANNSNSIGVYIYRHTINLKVPMRIIPTVTIGEQAASTYKKPMSTEISIDSVMLYYNADSTGQIVQTNYVEFSADL